MSDVFCEHIEHPYHFHVGRMPNSTSGSFASSRCGDTVRMDLLIVELRIEEAWHFAEGCIVARVGASILCEMIEGLTCVEAAHIESPQLLDAFGFRLTPFRQQCARVALHAMQAALSD